MTDSSPVEILTLSARLRRGIVRDNASSSSIPLRRERRRQRPTDFSIFPLSLRVLNLSDEDVSSGENRPTTDPPLGDFDCDATTEVSVDAADVSHELSLSCEYTRNPRQLIAVSRRQNVSQLL